jgi:hypothetical protein
LKTPNKHH